eukprot:EG_transcript_21456
MPDPRAPFQVWDDRCHELYEAGMAHKDRVERRHKEAVRQRWLRECQAPLGCTFQPQISPAASSIPRSGDVFSRLAIPKAGRPQLPGRAPDVPGSAQPPSNGDSSTTSVAPTQGATEPEVTEGGGVPRPQQRRVRASLPGFTFRPNVSPVAQRLTRGSNVFERLYQDGVQRQLRKRGADASEYDEYEEEYEEWEEEEDEEEEEEEEEQPPGAGRGPSERPAAGRGAVGFGAPPPPNPVASAAWPSPLVQYGAVLPAADAQSNPAAPASAPTAHPSHRPSSG